MYSNLKSFITNTFKGIPGYDFILEMWLFIKNPEIFDGNYEYVPLKNAGANLLKSILVIGSLMAALTFLSKKEIPLSSLSLIFRQFYLQLILVIQAIEFGVFFWLSMTIATVIKKRGWHIVYFLQVIQTYAIINIIIFFMLGIAVNRIFLTGDINTPVNSVELIVSATLAILVMYLSFRLLIAPSFRYLTRYYKTHFAIIITILVLFFTYLCCTNIKLDIWKNMINPEEVCKLQYNFKIAKQCSDEQEKTLFLNQCMNFFSQY